MLQISSNPESELVRCSAGRRPGERSLPTATGPAEPGI